MRVGLFQLLSLLTTALFLPETGGWSYLPAESSSPYIGRAWSSSDGLPGDDVTSITQTREGYLWIGTTEGLARFNGVEFRRFETGRDLAVTTLGADPDGGLWVGTSESGVIHWRDGTFDREAPGRLTGRVLSILALGKGEVLIGTKRGLLRLQAGKPLERVSAGTALDEVAVNGLSRAPDGVAWAAAANGLWKIEDGTLAQMAPRSVSIQAVAAGTDGILWMGGEMVGLMQLTPDAPAPKRVWPVSQVAALTGSANGDVWMTKGARHVERISAQKGATASIDVGEGVIHTLFEDREGSLWAGIRNSGLIQLQRRTVRLHELASESGAHGILSVAEDPKAQLWAAAENGLIYGLREKDLQPVPFRGPGAEPFFEAICASRTGGLWAGSRFDGLYHWDGRASTPFEKHANAVGITALFEDREERLWIASTREGVMVIERGILRVIRGPDGRSLEEVSSFAQDRFGQIWIGTRRAGLIEWAPQGSRWHPLNESDSPPRVHCLHADLDGNLWIGSNRGLTLRKDGGFATVSVENGLYDNLIYQIVEDTRGGLWFGSNRGIFRVSKSELLEFFAGKAQLIHSSPYTLRGETASLEGVGGAQPTVAAGTGGKLWFATRQGLASVDPAPLGLAEPPVVIEQVSADGAAIEKQERSVFILPPDHQSVEIGYAALTFAAPDQVRFRCRMSSVEPAWRNFGSARRATYSSLPPGDHEFSVQAWTDHGGWSESAASLTLRVPLRYWQTAWFKALLGGTIFAALALVWWDRRAKEQQMNALRQQITRDLHDDLGSNLGSIALLSEALRTPGRNIDSGEVLKEINRISRETLDAMRDAIWFVDPDKDTSIELVAHLKKIAESMLNGLSFEFVEAGGVARHKMPLRLKRGVVLIFKETLHNVIRHAGATQARVEVSLEGGRFRLRVTDNGRGFDAGGKAAGHGLRNMQHRANQLGGSLEITTQPGEGTAIQFDVQVDEIRRTSSL